uniref:Uncharacterized protein n=1 Tax=uncultured Alphaproteobacteria bacterium TaxID=91750 RepID=A0A6G8F327_9PROT|nr:hypothetical protein PlAlph_3630 [uncultured Alphaproteobacteria bacterium]
MQPTNIIYEIASKPIGELAELPAAELTEMQKEVETLIALADNVRKWLNGALMLKYSTQINEERTKTNRPYGEISFSDNEYIVTEDRPLVLEWQKDKLKEYAKRIAANGGNPEDYMDIDYTISEKKYCSLSDEARKSLNTAGNIRPGCTVITLAKRETVND